MNINDFKVGDKVKIINACCGDRSCNGKIGVITEEIANAGQFNLNRGINIKINDKEIWRVGFIACLELLPSCPSIHITTDGIETYAVLKEDGKVIKKSVTKCCKEDEFDFETGVKFAIDRLFEEKKKAEFKPHLISSFSSSFYGNIGKESSQVDVLGNRLNIGDTVDLYYGTEPRYETPVVKDDNVKTDFIMGLSGLIFTNGKAGDWTIVKNRSYEDVQDGETVGFIKYIKNDPSKAIISTYKY